MSITFKDLSNFLITSQSKTLSEASEKLNMSQPSLTLGIQKLEAELGYPLFIRSRDSDSKLILISLPFLRMFR